jgi:hypothetical protein
MSHQHPLTSPQYVEYVDIKIEARHHDERRDGKP